MLVCAGLQCPLLVRWLTVQVLHVGWLNSPGSEVIDWKYGLDGFQLSFTRVHYLQFC